MSLPDRAVGVSGLIDWTRLRAAWSPSLSRDISGALGRDPRLDMFRGLALVMIFINHVPGTLYENFTNRNFGFSDAAEAFVLMSGLAAGLAYSNGFRSGSLWSAATKVWARARQLYFVHIAITMISLALFAGAALWFDLPQVLLQNNIWPVVERPLSAMIGIPLMTHQLGYLNILPLYTLLLVVTPAIMLVGLRRPWLMLAVSVAVWAMAGQFRINLPNFPNSGGWFFNPFSWQLLFVLGLLCGAAMKEGRRLFPYHPVAFGLTAAFLVFVLFWVRIPEIGAVGRNALRIISNLGAPFYLTAFDKAFLTAPRLLHTLALFYVLSYLPVMLTLARSKWSEPLRTLGQQGLAVFATGTVISLFLQIVKTPRQPDPLFDGLILLCGLVALYALARLLNFTVQLNASRRRPEAPSQITQM